MNRITIDFVHGGHSDWTIIAAWSGNQTYAASHSKALAIAKQWAEKRANAVGEQVVIKDYTV